MKEIGRILREQRLKKNLELDQAHKDIKIQEKYLSAIEEGDMSAFLAEIYYKTFMKSYAKYLGLDPELLASQYEKEKCAGSEEKNETDGMFFTIEKKQICDDKNKKEKKPLDTTKLLVTFFVVVFLLLVFLYLNKNIASMIDDSGTVGKPAETKTAQEQSLPETLPQDLPKDSPVMPASVAPQVNKAAPFLPAVQPAQPAAVEKKNPEPKNTEKAADKKPANTFADNAKNEKIAAVTSAIQPAVMQTKIPQVNPEKPKLAIEAVENVWIKVEVDNREVFQGTVIKGDKKEWLADLQFNLKIGYTPGIKVFFDNEPVDVVK
ncbi:MAG: DUF4115 domain-containing protein, partial [Endomicrobia bacterium]|nr:DUF4115 domain-containing protein [Endomicrobiia bacterium]